MSEVPKHWLRISERSRLATDVVLHAPNYDVVKGFGTSYHIIPKDGHKSVQLSSIQDSEVIYPEIKDPKDRHATPTSRTIYSSSE